MSKTIIVIDDDYDDYIFLKDAIEEFDPAYQCVYFDDSDCAMTTMGVETYACDYVFIDINMPVHTGDECLRMLRNNPVLQRVTIVMLSTFMPDDLAAALKREGATLAFQKPNTMIEYSDILNKVFLH